MEAPDIIFMTRLQQLGQVQWIEKSRVSRPTLMWFPEKEKTGRCKKSRNKTLTEDVDNIELMWDDFGETADVF